MLEKFVETEYRQLSEIYNPDSFIKNVTIKFESEKYFRDFKNTVETDRRGEVGFLLMRKNGKFVVIRSRKYPKHAFRIPTGGIDFDERAIDALYREIKEELGVKFEIDNFKGIIEYNFYYKEEIIKFYSYLFVVKEVSGNLISDATEDEISEYREVDREELDSLVHTLLKIEGGWRDWARFRAELIKFYLDI